MEKIIKALEAAVVAIKAEAYTTHREMALGGLQTALDHLPKHIDAIKPAASDVVPAADQVKAKSAK